MSNALAIAATTAVIRDLLADGLIDANLDALGDFVVSSMPLERLLNQQGPPRNRLNLLLLQTTPNPAWSNARLPTHDSRGGRVARPLLALDLHYLVTAIGVEEFAAEVLLGYAEHLLHEHPVIGANQIRQALGQGAVDGQDLPPLFANLAAAELADQFEAIRLVRTNPDMEEWSRIWSAMNVGLRPSATYMASVVLIEGQAPTRTPLPVLHSHIGVHQIRRPRITRVMADPGGGAMPDVNGPMNPGGTLLLHGSGLTGADATRVSLDGRELLPEAGATADAMRVVIPVDTSAGVVTIQVLHYAIGPGGPADLQLREQSNAQAVGIRPVIAADDPGPPAVPAIELTNRAVNPDNLVSGTVTVRLAHPVRTGQRASLRLTGRDAASGAATSVTAPPLQADATAVDFAVSRLVQGPYLVRIEVDGAESIPAFDATGFTGPLLQVAP